MAHEAMVKTLFERERIRETTHRYCYSVDRGSLDELMDLFADPCDLVLGPGERFAGRAAVRDWYGAYIQGRPEVLRHLIHNQIISLDGDKANDDDRLVGRDHHSPCRARVKSYFDTVADLKGEAIVGAGFYDDTLRQFDGRWKFTEKIIKIDFLVPLKDGWGGEKLSVQPWW